VTGLRPMLGIHWRTRRRTILVWVLALVGSMLFTAVAVARLYDTPEKVPTYAEAVASDALVAINGRVEGLDTLGGIVQDEFGFMASFLMPLFGIALVAAMTGTNSLKLALEQLLGGRCHHMHEVMARPELVGLWMAAADGRPDWDAIFAGDVATVDWPATAFWRELVAANPDAKVLLSMRATPEAWWRSAQDTIFQAISQEGTPPEIAAWMASVQGMLATQGVVVSDEAGSLAAYRRHIDDVRSEVPASA